QGPDHGYGAGARYPWRYSACQEVRLRRSQRSREALTMTGGFDVVGKSTPKLDGPDKVTGRTCYLHDLELPRLAHGKILRTRLPHARIVRLDASRARARAGVLAVVTGADAQQHPFGFAQDQLALHPGRDR